LEHLEDRTLLSGDFFGNSVGVDVQDLRGNGHLDALLANQQAGRVSVQVQVLCGPLDQFTASIVFSATENRTDTANSSITGALTGITEASAAAIALEVSGFPSTTTAGTAGNVTVTAKDRFGNTTTGYTGTVHFSSSDAQAWLPSDYTFTSADAGIHTFSVTLKTAGTQSITATDTANSSLTGSQTGITVNAGLIAVFTLAFQLGAASGRLGAGNGRLGAGSGRMVINSSPEAPLAVVVTLVAGPYQGEANDIFKGGQIGVTNRVPVPPPELTAQPGGDMDIPEEKEPSRVNNEFVPDVDEALCRLELYQPIEEPGFADFMSVLENLPAILESEPSVLTSLLEGSIEDPLALAGKWGPPGLVSGNQPWGAVTDPSGGQDDLLLPCGPSGLIALGLNGPAEAKGFSGALTQLPGPTGELSRAGAEGLAQTTGKEARGLAFEGSEDRTEQGASRPWNKVALMSLAAGAVSWWSEESRTRNGQKGSKKRFPVDFDPSRSDRA
jgi:hypothetical protein